VELRRALSSLLAALLGFGPAAAFGQTVGPPPPPMIFDPKPGPWIVYFEPGSAEFSNDDQLEIIRTATRSWGSVERSSLLLCYDGSWTDHIALERVRAVASALREAGSPRILVDQGWLCDRVVPSASI
jgi:hypothetical protein